MHVGTHAYLRGDDQQAVAELHYVVLQGLATIMESSRCIPIHAVL